MPAPSANNHPTPWCVAQSRWLAEDLGARHLWPFDLPHDVPPDQAVWVPGLTAARWLAAARRPPVLRSPGRRWPDFVPAGVPTVDRTLIASADQWSRTPRWPGTLFVKLADAKDERFPAAERTHSQTVADLSGIGGFSQLLLSPVRAYSTEVRVFVSTAGISTSMYRDGPVFFDSGDLAAQAHTLVVPAGLAPGTVWDFGLPADGGPWEVVEFNAPWSSAWYGCDTQIVRQALIDAVGSDLPRWDPDAVYRRRTPRSVSPRTDG